MKNDSLMDEAPVDELPEWSDSELVPLISLEGSPVVEMMDMTGCPLPKCSELLSPRSPVTIGFEDLQGTELLRISSALIKQRLN